ncbi:MAG: hypothetical protein AB7M05_02600 [Alphaproteobacteria bacterium]
MTSKHVPARHTDWVGGPEIAAICLAYAAVQFALSLRFLTSASLSLASVNAFKPLLAGFLVLATGLYIAAALHAPRPIARLLGSPVLLILLLAFLAIAEWYLYPLLDRVSLKLAGEGSDADDALIDAAQRLLAGQPAYAAPTYRGNSISPGIGWIVLNLPWASASTFFLLTPFYLGVLGVAVRVAAHSWVPANLTVIGHVMCLGILEIAPTGDLAAFGAALAATFVAAYIARDSVWSLAAVALVMGTVSTGRIPFALFPLLAAAVLWRVTDGRSLILGLVGFGTAVAWHLTMAGIDSVPYQPLHLFGKGGFLLPGAWLYLAAFASAAAVLIALLRQKPGLAPAALRCGICLGVPLAFLALAHLASIGFHTGVWEGANYLAPSLSFFTVALAMLAMRARN